MLTAQDIFFQKETGIIDKLSGHVCLRRGVLLWDKIMIHKFETCCFF